MKKENNSKQTAQKMSLMKRSKYEIIAEILSLCKQPQKKTQITCKTNLPWKRSQMYLSQLLSTGFLEIHHSHIKYATTPKGLEFIEKWKEIEVWTKLRINING